MSPTICGQDVSVKPFDISLPADLAYYVAYLPRALERPKVKAFRDWLFAEAESAA